MKKKGSTNIVMIIMGVGVIVMSIVLLGVLGGKIYDNSAADIASIGANVVTMESFAASNTTRAKLAHGMIQTWSVTVINGTGKNLQSGNYTIDYDAGYIVFNHDSDAPFVSGTTCKINYTWGSADIREHTLGAIIGGFNGLKQAGTLTPIMVIGLIVIALLGMLMGMVAYSGQGGQPPL